MKHKCPTCTCRTKPASIGKFIKIKAGTFMMGSPATEEGRWDDEVQREISIKAFELCATTVTQKQYNGAGGDEPVVNVSWDDAQEWIAELNKSQEKYTYRLPAEAEWEYACRAGTTTPYSFPHSELSDHAWYCNNSSNKTNPVAQKKPNPWGLYDMHGNVWEWCQDLYKTAGSDRVVRGGSWLYDAWLLRSAVRFSFGPGVRYSSVGFRLARSRR